MSLSFSMRCIQAHECTICGMNRPSRMTLREKAIHSGTDVMVASLAVASVGCCPLCGANVEPADRPVPDSMIRDFMRFMGFDVRPGFTRCPPGAVGLPFDLIEVCS